MSKDIRKVKPPTEDDYGQRPMAFHPYNIFLTLVLAGITMLFLAFSIAYVYTRFQSGVPTIQIPNIFILNTLILIASSFTMRWANQCYKKDETEKYQYALLITTVLTFLFMILQIVGWKELTSQNVYLATTNMASYLYVLSGLHFVHIIAGLPFLILFYITARQRMKEPVSVLVYFSDPEKRLKLKLLTVYWHFLDALWIYLILFFLINRLF